MKLKKNYPVVKRNILNDLLEERMKVTEMRFFSVYLSRINPKDPATRVVRFPLAEYARIMEIQEVNEEHIKNTFNRLICRPIHESTDKGGIRAFPLFKECIVDPDEHGEWYVEINANDRALPLLFGIQSDFFKYKLFNILRLKSTNQFLMYEILKRWEYQGWVVFAVDEIRERLRISEGEYPRFGDFKMKVLDVCQKAIAQYTDIKFTYAPYGMKGKHGKILQIKFIIMANKDYTDQLTLDMFIDEQQAAAFDGLCEDDWDEDGEYDSVEEAVSGIFRKKIMFLMEACSNEFNFQEMVVLWNTMREHLPYSLIKDDIQCYDFLSNKYQEMLMRNQRTKINHRHGYLRSIIGKDYEP